MGTHPNAREIECGRALGCPSYVHINANYPDYDQII